MIKQGDDIRNFEQVLKDPALVQLHEAIHYIEKTSFSQAFPKKHEAGLISYVQHKTIELFNEKPNLPLKIIVTTVLNKITDTDISASLMLKLTKNIIKTREKLLEISTKSAEATSIINKI